MFKAVRKPVSVCIALFNGEKYIEEQINSILPQLDNDADELIIIDDFSTDNSIKKVMSYNYPNIYLYKNEENLGYIKTFEKLIGIAKNEILFLSDQDDIWVEGRLINMYEKLNEKDNLLVCSNFFAFNNQGEEVIRSKTKLTHRNSGETYTKNIIDIFKGNIPYFGCTMAFNSKLKRYILPFPSYISAHDLWIAMVANVIKKIVHLEEVTLYHRIHDKNTSFIQRKLHEKLFTRFLFLKMWIDAYKRSKIK